MAEATEKDLARAVLKRFSSKVRGAPRWIVAFQVHNAAGTFYTRRLDAVVLDTLPSKGITLHGIEMKINQADLRRELRNPKKFHDFEPFLDYFSIVTVRGVLGLDLLPKKWGAYTLKDDGGLHTLRAPLPLHDDAEKTVPRSIMASFTRALVTRSMSQEAIDVAYEQGRADAESQAAKEIERVRNRAERRKEAIQDFEKASGVKIDVWDGGKVGEAVNLVLRGGLGRHLSYGGDIRSVGERLIRLADELDRIKEGLEASDQNGG